MHCSNSLFLLIAFVGLLSCKSEANTPAILDKEPVVQSEVLVDKSEEGSIIEEDKLESKELDVIEPASKQKPEVQAEVVSKEDIVIINEKPTSSDPTTVNVEDSDISEPLPNNHQETDPLSKEPMVDEAVYVERPVEIESNSSVDEPKEVEVKLEEAGLHDSWGTLLSNYVSSTGVVNYKGLKAQETQLDAYLALLSENVPSGKSDKAMAYWMNAYNAFTVKLILANYPIASIRDLNDGNPWDVQWIELGGESYSLNRIEHEILRPTYKDPRIHFGVNCAAKSCPKLGNEAFTADGLDSQLDKLTRSFVNNKQANTIQHSSIQLSKIFEWYKEDFGDLTSFIIKYAEEKVSPSASVSFKDYDWSLNGK